MNSHQRGMWTSSDHFENIGLTPMKEKVSLFPQLKNPDKRACLSLQEQCYIYGQKKYYLLTYYDRNDTTASKTRIGMVLLKQKKPSWQRTFGIPVKQIFPFLHKGNISLLEKLSLQNVCFLEILWLWNKMNLLRWITTPYLYHSTSLYCLFGYLELLTH